MIDLAMSKTNIIKFKLHITILLFVTIFALTNYMKPSCLYKSDGSARLFGIGYKNKTIIPVWVYSICLAILSYIGVSWYVL